MSTDTRPATSRTRDLSVIPTPVPETTLRSLTREIAETYQVAACLLYADGTPFDLPGGAGEPVPSAVEFAAEIAGRQQARYFASPRSPLIRLVIPISSRRQIWGYLVASYLPLEDAGAPSPWSAASPTPLYARAAAPVLLNAIDKATRSLVLIRQQVDDLDDLAGKMLQSYEEISLLYRLGQHFNVGMRPQQVLDFTCRELSKLLGPRRSVACAATATFAARGSDADEPLSSSSGPARLRAGELEELSRWYGSRGFSWGQPVIVNESFPRDPPRNWLEPRCRLLMVPICFQREMLGLLVSTAPLDCPEFDSRDAQLMANLATQIGAHWKNFLLFEELRQLFLSVVRALVSAIDAKDPYTFGHSERVALVARRLARAATLDEDEVDTIYLSGLLHDIGKIGIREEVLLKPTRLTSEEWDHLRQHPDIGARILQPVAAMARVVPGVRHHHECMNGMGYPSGLRGAEIPRMARIIAIADAFDAMSTDRPYRRALSLDEILDVFRAGRDIQWDGEFIDRMLELLQDPDFLCRYQELRSSHSIPHREEIPALVPR